MVGATQLELEHRWRFTAEVALSELAAFLQFLDAQDIPGFPEVAYFVFEMNSLLDQESSILTRLQTAAYYYANLEQSPYIARLDVFEEKSEEKADDALIRVFAQVKVRGEEASRSLEEKLAKIKVTRPSLTFSPV